MGNKKVLILIDLANVTGQARALGRKLDVLKLVQFLSNQSEGRELLEALVYAPIMQDNEEKATRWHDFLRHHGLIVISKRAKRMPDGTTKANMDGLLTLDALELAISAKPEVIILVTGDGDFAPLAHRLRRWGIRVECAATSQALATELHSAVNGHIKLEDFLTSCDLPKEQATQAIGPDNILETDGEILKG